MKPTLVILAAGMASRYGSMKQTDGMGPNGETILEYSIYDAIKAGFGKVSFIIRKQFEEVFRETFDAKFSNLIQTEYLFQELDMYVDKDKIPAERTKPWGTAHAILCTKEFIKEPFAVINADDFYGRDAFEMSYKFLTTTCSANHHAVIGYKLSNTLSENGSVNRGVCEATNNKLTSIVERINIKQLNSTEAVCDDNLTPKNIPIDSIVSMNLWCFHQNIFDALEKYFKEFFATEGQKPKSEFFIPLVADNVIKDGGEVEVISTNAKWFGVTYKEDAPAVKKKLNQLITEGVYPANLWQV